MDNHLTSEACEIAQHLYGKIEDLKSLHSGTNSVFRIQVGEHTKILKMAVDPDGSWLRREAVISRILKEHGIPSSDVEYEDIDGKLTGRAFIIMNSAGEKTLASLSLGQLLNCANTC
jgi:hypothetical protein